MCLGDRLCSKHELLGGRSVKKEFLETASDLFPFLLGRLGKLIGIGAEALVQQSDREQGFAAASGGEPTANCWRRKMSCRSG